MPRRKQPKESTPLKAEDLQSLLNQLEGAGVDSQLFIGKFFHSIAPALVEAFKETIQGEFNTTMNRLLTESPPTLEVTSPEGFVMGQGTAWATAQQKVTVRSGPVRVEFLYDPERVKADSVDLVCAGNDVNLRIGRQSWRNFHKVCAKLPAIEDGEYLGQHPLLFIYMEAKPVRHEVPLLRIDYTLIASLAKRENSKSDE